MKSQNNSKIIKRPKKITTHKRQHLVARVQMAAKGDVTLTPTLSQHKKLNTSKSKHKQLTVSTSTTKKKNKPRKKVSAVKDVKVKRNENVQRKRKESGPKPSIKEVNVSMRKKWVSLNKKQTDFLSNALNSAVSFATSHIDTNSAEKFETQNCFVNATRSILMQRVSKVKVPTTKQAMTKPMSNAMFMEVSEDLDSRIHSLTEAIDREKKLLQEKQYLIDK